MKNDGAKRVMIVVLAACLLGILYMCYEGDTIIRLTAEVANPRQNVRLWLERIGETAVRVGGEGKLFGTDMRAMIEGERMNVNDVTDIIIDGGITEIGYDAVVAFEGLRTLRIGPDVKTIVNGAVRECKALQFVFVPGGLIRAGKDFLYDCNQCILITDGQVNALPKMKNVNKDIALGEVDSFELLQAACEDKYELPDIVKLWWD